MENIRESFEIWAAKEGYNIKRYDNGRYISIGTAQAWEAFVAGYKLNH